MATQDPSGLSRWSGGRWTHYPRSDGRSGGFAVSGTQVWVASDSGLDRFDGQKWQKLPAAVIEPMAKTLVRTHGRLWFIHNTAWYSSDGREWTEWKESRTVRNWTRGSSGGRVWLGTGDSLIGIGDDLLATEFALDSLRGGSVYGVHAGDGHVMIAGGGRGLYERMGDIWRPVPVDAALHSEDVRSVASTPDGGVWITTSRLLDLRRMFGCAGLILGVLLIWNLRAKRQEKDDSASHLSSIR